jgi:hypothetical protein
MSYGTVCITTDACRLSKSHRRLADRTLSVSASRERSRGLSNATENVGKSPLVLMLRHIPMVFFCTIGGMKCDAASGSDLRTFCDRPRPPFVRSFFTIMASGKKPFGG